MTPLGRAAIWCLSLGVVAYLASWALDASGTVICRDVVATVGVAGIVIGIRLLLLAAGLVEPGDCMCINELF
jgi:hypothetical protein